MTAKISENHFLVPVHELISDKEKEALVKDLGLKFKEMPRIKRLDPAVKKLKPKKGDVVRIIRPSRTAGEALYYRVVI